MASGMESIHMSEDLLNEVRSFVHGSHPVHGHKLTSEEHAKSAIHLLRTLPSARSAVLEHLCHVFDESVNSHVVELDGEESLAPNLDDMIEDIHRVLLGFVKKNPEGWAPLIFTWAIDLLGQISSQYAGRRGVPHSSSLNELLQLWMTCKATRSLMEIATQCVAVLIKSCPDFCVDALLDTSVLHSPHFDWVVAHIGSCFPETIITRVLSCGLKDFCSHGNTQGDPITSSEKKVPKMASVVGILGHLASQHSKDIRKALLELFQASLHSTDEQQLSTVPFLLQLATMSPMLLKVITNDLVDYLTPEVLNILSNQFRSSAVILKDADGLLTLVIHLICKSGSGACKLLHFVLDTAAPQSSETGMEFDVVVSPQVQQCAALILDLLLLDLQRSVYSKHSAKYQSAQSEMSEIPFLIELQKHTNDLCRDILTATEKRLYWLQRLLSVIGVHCGESCASDILSYLMLNADSQDKSSQVRLLLDLQAEFESSLQNVMKVAAQKSLYHLQHADDIQTLHLLNNFTLLVKWERSEQGRQRSRVRLKSTLQSSVQILSCLLHHHSPAVSYQTIRLLYLVGLPDNIAMDTLLNIARCTVHYFCILLHRRDRTADEVITVTKYLTMVSSHPPGQTEVIRFLIQGVMSKENRCLFGGGRGGNDSSPESSGSKLSLHEDNKKHALSVTVPATASTVFHSGIIGKGKRSVSMRNNLPQDVQMRNTQAVLDALYSCGSVNLQNAANDKGQSVTGLPKILAENSATCLAELLVALVCPDVIHTGILWPDEEYMKYTIERDLHIKRTFEDSPILWELLRVVAKSKPALRHCSVLVYGLLSTLLVHWESDRQTKACMSPKQLQSSARLVECMLLSDFLPACLGHVSELFYLLTPYEVYLLLINIWSFMKENPPSAQSYSAKDGMGRPARIFETVDPKFTKIIHSTLHHNIEKCGHLYPRFFPERLTTSR